MSHGAAVCVKHGHSRIGSLYAIPVRGTVGFPVLSSYTAYSKFAFVRERWQLTGCMETSLERRKLSASSTLLPGMSSAAESAATVPCTMSPCAYRIPNVRCRPAKSVRTLTRSAVPKSGHSVSTTAISVYAAWQVEAGPGLSKRRALGVGVGA